MFKKWTGQAGPAKDDARTAPVPTAVQGAAGSSKGSTKARGDVAEDRALAWLQDQGLTLVQRNYRVARGPQARGGEVDLLMREPDGTLVFVEVRQRRNGRHGGAAASVGTGKQRRVVYAAQHFLLRLASPPPCRFDVVAIDGDELQWLRAAFDAGAG